MLLAAGAELTGTIRGDAGCMALLGPMVAQAQAA